MESRIVGGEGKCRQNNGEKMLQRGEGQTGGEMAHGRHSIRMQSSKLFHYSPP